MEESDLSEEKRDRFEEIKEQMSRFAQQVNDLLRHNGARNGSSPAPENELAICRHARAIVDEQLKNPPDETSKAKLLNMRKELSRRINALEDELNDASFASKNSMSLEQKLVVGGMIAAGIGLVGLGVFLLYQQRESPDNFRQAA
jgi:predicted nuclease with TOPRIM domain